GDRVRRERMTNRKCLGRNVPDTFDAKSAHLTGLKMRRITRAVSIDRIAFDPRRAGLQNIELARISQDVRERFYNLLAIGETGHCPATGRLKRQSPDGPGSGAPTWSLSSAACRTAPLAKKTRRGGAGS